SVTRDDDLPLSLLEEMVEAGLDRVEVDHREHDDAERARLRDFADRHGLLSTGGSDYHGSGKPNELGENLTAPEVLAAIEERGAGCTSVTRPGAPRDASRRRSRSALPAAGAAATTTAAGAPASLLGRLLAVALLADHLAVDPAGAGTAALAARPPAPVLLAAALGALTLPGPVLTITAAPAASPAGTVAAACGGRAAEILDLLGVQPLAGALFLGQSALGGLRDVEIGEQMLRGRIGLHRLGGLHPQLARDQRPARQILPVHEGQGRALLARATGAAGAVEVGLVV